MFYDGLYVLTISFSKQNVVSYMGFLLMELLQLFDVLLFRCSRFHNCNVEMIAAWKTVSFKFWFRSFFLQIHLTCSQMLIQFCISVISNQLFFPRNCFVGEKTFKIRKIINLLKRLHIIRDGNVGRNLGDWSSGKCTKLLTDCWNFVIYVCVWEESNIFGMLIFLFLEMWKVLDVVKLKIKI